MKKWQKRLIIFVSAVIFFVLGLTVYSHIRYDRSVSSTVVERILWFMKDPKSIKETQHELSKMKEDGEKKYELSSKLNFDVPVKKTVYEGMDTYVLNGEKNNGTVILYIHGGGYVNQPVIQHWDMLNRVAKNTNSKIVVPIYPLAPFSTYEESYSLLTSLYQSIESNQDTKKIVLMGDSAGGGLSLGLAETFNEKNIPQPNALVLLSPWVDVTMKNSDIKEYEKKDPMLDRNALIAYGESWAGSTDTKDYRVSPLYGNISHLKNVTIFVGTREQFYPDIMKLNDKLKEAGVKTKVHVGIGQNHVYPCIPVKEGREAIKQISNLVNGL